MVSLMVILFSTKCSLLAYMYTDLLKLKAFKLIENSDADRSWLLFLMRPACSNLIYLSQIATLYSNELSFNKHLHIGVRCFTCEKCQICP